MKKYNDTYKTLATCPLTAKNVGDMVSLSVNITQGVAPYSITYKKDGIPISPPVTFPTIGTYQYDYITTSTDAGGHTFGVDVYDSCSPTPQLFTDQCSVIINSCITPSCDFTWMPVNPKVGELVTISSSDPQNITSHNWIINAVQYITPTVPLIFDTAGTYTISHDCVNELCMANGTSITKTITVSPTPVTTGSIYCTTTPLGAMIWLDGLYSGQLTPFTLTNIQEGNHRLTFTLNGYTGCGVDVNLGAGTIAGATCTLTSLCPPLTLCTMTGCPTQNVERGTQIVLDVSWIGGTPNYTVQLLVDGYNYGNPTSVGSVMTTKISFGVPSYWTDGNHTLSVKIVDSCLTPPQICTTSPCTINIVPTCTQPSCTLNII